MRYLYAPIVALCLLLLPAAYSPPPVPVGPWTANTPTVSAASGTLTAFTSTGKFQFTGKRVDFSATGIITTNGTGASAIYLGLPPNLPPAGDFMVIGAQQGVTGKLVSGTLNTGLGTSAYVRFFDATYPGANGAKIVISGFYETP